MTPLAIELRMARINRAIALIQTRHTRKAKRGWRTLRRESYARRSWGFEGSACHGAARYGMQILEASGFYRPSHSLRGRHYAYPR